MKKLISIFCVVAMLFSVAVTVNAADNEFSIVKVDQDATSATYDVYLNTTTALYGFNTYLDMAAAISAGVPNSTKGIAVTAQNGTTAKYASKLIAISYANTTGEESAMFTSNKIATIVLDTSAITGSFDISKSTKRASSVKKYVDGEGTIDITADYTFNLDVTVAPYVPEVTKDWVAQEAVSAKAGTYANYEDVVVLTVDVALDAAAEKYGFDLTDGTNSKAFELEGLAGEGAVEYVVAFWGVPSNVTITATPRAYK